MRRISAGLIDGASFAFRVTKQSWNDARDVRTIQSVDINRGDVSICNEGANDAASVAARSRKEQGFANDPEFYRLLAAASALGATPRTNVALAAARARRKSGYPLSLAQARARDLALRNEAGRRR